MVRKVRSNHNSLLNYFIHDKRDLSPAYVRKCEKFFKELKEPDAWIKRQASSSKRQASSSPAGLNLNTIKK